MKSSGLVRRWSALGASTAVLAAMVTGLMATPSQAATASTAAKAATATAAKPKPRFSPSVSLTTPKASPGDYSGSCPVKISFSSKIKVKLKGKTEVAYRWLHGDGSKSKVKVVKLSGKGTKSFTVRQSITFKGEVKGWEAIQVLGPRKVTSKKGYFSVDCGKDSGRDHDKDGDYGRPGDKSVSVNAWANPDSYAGPCTPGDKIDFHGVIKVGSPRWVYYRWVLNGKVVERDRIKVWNSRKVGFGFSPRESHRGWAELQVGTRGDWAGDRAYYKVWCKSEAPATRVSVSTPTTGTNHNTCAVGANATISATGRGRVEWVWSVNGKSVAKGDTYFSGADRKLVELPEQALSGDATKGGTVSIHVTGPNNNDSASQSYAACQKQETPAKSVKVSLEAVTDQSTCKNGSGATMKVTATVTADGAAKGVVVQLWSEVGGFSHNATVDFAAAGTQTVSWSLPAKGTNGVHAKATLANGASSSDLRTYGDHCPKVEDKPATEDTPAEDAKA
ncbi:hypothetical protein [Nonomuraea sp. NPDC046570]|uniref:hypothetical protein n=1 Tax=Nonomuraea sp. NPDC046570 TaxID=3155255 RepID=UPI0033EE4E6C